jgi:predicted acetyltransferase
MGSIRSLRSEDMEASIKLSQYAFQYELSQEELRERLARAKPEQSWGMFQEDGSLAAKLTILPLETYIDGTKISMGGIAGVATWPEHRREGLIRRLLTHSLGVMKEQGQIVSCLHPFQFEFYRRYGWETYTEYKKYELETGQLPRFPVSEGRVERQPGQELLASIYDAYAQRFNGTLVRTTEWWEWNILTLKNKGGASAVYYGADGSPKGYMLYKVRDRIMTINEFVALDTDARRGLWGFIANHDSMIGKVLFQAEAGDRLTSLLKDPRIKQETIPYFMARLVDVKAFLAGFRFHEGSVGCLSLAVTDQHAPWNEGVYKLEIRTDGGVTVDFRPTENPAAQEDGLLCGVGILTSMLLGYERPLFWYENGLMSGSRSAAELLESAIPNRTCALLDFF